MIESKHNSARTVGLIQVFDSLSAAVALLLLSPILLMVMLVLRFSGERDVFYRQTRLGYGGREFQLLKFATMQKNSPSMGSGELTLPNDPRVFPVGRFLRKSKINELPQLWNVLIGDLSLIGPRPQTHRYYLFFSQEDREVVSRVKPGLSGVGSIIFRDEEAMLAIVPNPVEFDDKIITPYKGKIERWFVEQQSVLLYFELILLTVMVVLFPRAGLHKRLLQRVPSPPPALAKLLEII